MNNFKAICLIGTASLVFQSCMPTAHITAQSQEPTESFIKNYVEKHEPGEFSTLKTCQLFITPTLNGGYLELTAYKYNSKKALVISASENFSQPAQGQPKTIQGKTVFIQLSIEQAKAISDNYQALISRINEAQPILNETVYHDYTASSELFISYRRSYSTFAKQAANYVDLWINGNKFTVHSSEIMKKIDAFLKY
jgi:hypothetical protein